MRLIENCLVCEGGLSKVGYLGYLYPSAFIDSPSDESRFKRTETWVNWCAKCKNMQACQVEDGEALFRDYYYNSGINLGMKASLLDIVTCKHAQDTYLLEDGEFSWLDIASNDNTMLTQVNEEYDDVFTVGIDPAKITNRKDVDLFINDFFSADLVRQRCRVFYEKENVRFNIISCIAMMYDIEKIHEFIEDVKSLLREDGTFIVQLMDLESRLKTYAIEDNCQEHVICYSLECLDKLFKQHGLEIYDCEYNKTNCSSLRIYVGFLGVHDRRENVDQMILFQSEYFNTTNMLFWEEQVGRKLKYFKDYLVTQKALGKKLYLVGASTKANTLLQLTGINDKLIDSALELSSFKWGKYMLGSNIPIVPEKEFLNNKQDYRDTVFILAIWAFKDGIKKNYQKYLDLGAELIVPFPSLHKITKDGEFLL